MPVMTLSTLLTPGSSVTAALVFPGTAPSLLFMYLQWVCPNNAPDLQRATIVYGPPVILHFTLWSQLDVTELMSGQIITCVPELIQRMLLCTVSLADRAASYVVAPEIQFISVSQLVLHQPCFVPGPAKQHSFAAWNHHFVNRCGQTMSDKHLLLLSVASTFDLMLVQVPCMQMFDPSAPP